MKLKHLLLLLCLVLIGVGQMRAQIAVGDYFIQNVGYEGYLNGANAWGTKASLTKHGQKMTIAVSGEGYSINSHISNGQGLNFLAAGDSTFLDGATATHTITDLGDGTYTIKDTNNKYLAASEGIVNFNATEVTDAAKWKFISMDDVNSMLETATYANPKDATFFIGDANFSRNNQYESAWTVDKLSESGTYELDKNGADYKNGTFYSTGFNAQKWGGNSNTFDAYQTLTGLPNGIYILSAQGFYRYNNTNDNTNDVASAAHADGTEVINAYLYANDVKVELKSIADEAAVTTYGKMPFSQTEAAEAFSKDLYNNTLMVVVTDGTLRIGIKKTTHQGTDWTVWDNFELYYCGSLNSMIVNPNFVSNDNGWDKVGNVVWKNAANYTGPDGVVGIIEMGKWDKDTGQTFDDKISQTLNDLPNGYYRLKAGLQSASNVYMTLFANEQATQYLSHGDTNGNTGKKGWDWVEVITYVNDGTLTFGATAAANNAKQAWANCDMFSLEYLGSDLPENSDVTCYLSNPSFEGGNMNGWTVENNGGDWTCMDRPNAGDPKSGRYWYEKYKFAGKIDVNQTVSGMPAGHYRVSVLAVDQSNQTKLIAETATNSNETVIKKEPSDRYTVDIFVNEGEDLKLGLYCENHPANKWVGFDDFRLTYLSSEFAALEPLEGAMNATVKSDMLSKIDTYNSNKNMDNLKAAWNAMAVAKASINAYTKARYYLDEAQDAKATKFTTYSADDYATAVDALETKYTNGEFTDAQATSYNYLIGDHTSGVVPAYMLGGWDNTKIYINTWSTEGDTDGSNFKAPFYEYWVADANSLANREITGTITDLPNGTYSITAFVRVRAKNDVAVADATGITMSANGGDAVDVTEGTQIGTSQLSMAEFTAIGVVTDGTLNLTFNVADANISWLAFKNVKYTRIGSDEELKVFKDAITNVESSYPLGFQKDEYAPYKNVAAAQALAAAKAVDTESIVDFSTLSTLQSNLENATWTANTEDMDAFYDGTFETYAATYRVDSYGLKGWTTETTSNMRQMREDFAGNGKGLYIWPTTIKYGEVAGYTMPLAANTVYRFEMSYGGWNNTVGNGPTISLLNAETGIAAQNIGGAPKFDQGVTTIVKYFKTVEAGDYIFTYVAPNGTNTVVGNFSLVKAVEVARTTASSKYGTLCLPYAFTTEGATLYTISNIDGTHIELAEIAESGQAGVPYIYCATADEQTFAPEACNGVLAPVAGNNGLTGSFVLAPVPAGNYVMQTQNGVQGFYKVPENTTVNCGQYKCYLQAPAQAREAYTFGGEETSIEALNALTSGKAEIYDLNGRRLERLQKGINIVNGTKIIVK